MEHFHLKSSHFLCTLHTAYCFPYCITCRVENTKAIKLKLIMWKSDNKYSDEEAKQKLHELLKDPQVNYCGLYDEIYHKKHDFGPNS